jgi:ATP-dependent DNA ligase
LTGEAVVCDERGITDFEAFRSALARRKAQEAFLYAFDMLGSLAKNLPQNAWEARVAPPTRITATPPASFASRS